MLRPFTPLVSLLYLTAAAAGQWTESTVPEVDGEVVDLEAVHAVAADNIVAVGRTGGFPQAGIVYRWNGGVWELLHVEAEDDHSISLYDVWAVGDTVFAVGEAFDVDTADVQPFVLQGTGNTLLRSNLDGVAAAVRGIWGVSDSSVFAVGTGLDVASSTLVLEYDGSAWAPRDLPASGNSFGLTEIWGTAVDHLIVMGCCDQLRFDGTNWNFLFPEEFGIWNGLHGTSPADVFAVGWDNFNLVPISVFHDGTVSDAMVSIGAPAGLTSEFEGVWAHPDVVYATGATSVYRLEAGGWVAEASTQGRSLEGIHGTNDGNAYAVGRGGVVLSTVALEAAGIAVEAGSGETSVDGESLAPGESVALTGPVTVTSSGSYAARCEAFGIVGVVLGTFISRRDDIEDCESRFGYWHRTKCLTEAEAELERFYDDFVVDLILEPNRLVDLVNLCLDEGILDKGAAQPILPARLLGGSMLVRADPSGPELLLSGDHAEASLPPGASAELLQAPDSGATVFRAVDVPILVEPFDGALSPVTLEPGFEMSVSADGQLPPLATALFRSSFEGEG